MRRLLAVAVAFVLLGLSAAAWLTRPGRYEPNVILIVLDTVRSDYLSLCGADRPTSPTLKAFAARPGASFTCGAVAPGTWTLPSHASFFTGVSPLDHHAHEIVSGVGSFKGAGSRAAGLPAEGPARRQTLAEAFVEAGYATVAVSANPVVNDALGLMRGFQSKRIGKRFEELRGDKLSTALDEKLATVESSKPLFLFVNIADAHQRWNGVPRNHPWATPARAPLKYRKLDANSVWRRWLEGRMPEEEQARYSAALDQIYAYNVSLADQSLAGVLNVIQERGLCDQACRITIVSDHGEMLGERDLLDHGHYVWENNVRVPLLHWSTEQRWFSQGPLDPPPDLELPVNGLHAYHLARWGQIPRSRAMPATMAWPHARRCFHTKGHAYCDTTAAIWDHDNKYLWRSSVTTGEEQFLAFDLIQDPMEEQGVSMGDDHPWRQRLERYKQQVQTHSGAQQNSKSEVLEALKAFGYLD